MKDFIKFTFLKLTLAILFMISSVMVMRFVISSFSPTENIDDITETLFFKFMTILHVPAFATASTAQSLCSFVYAHDSPACFNSSGFAYFIVNILTYYLLACLLIYFFKKIWKLKDKLNEN